MPKSNVFLQILILLSFVATWSSQSLLDLCTILLLIILISNKNFLSLFASSISENKVPLLLFSGYFAVACLGYLFNARPGAEIGTLRKFDWILLYIIIYMVIKSLDGKFSELTVDRFKFLFLIPALYGFTIFLTGNKDFLTGRMENDSRIVGMVNSPTYHAHIGIMIVAVFLILIWESKKLTVPNILILATIGASTLLTRTRGAIIALIVGLGAYFIAVLFKKKLLTKKILIILLLASLVIAVMPAFLITRSDSTSIRQDLIKVHVEMIKRNPILGIGYRDNLRDITDYCVPTCPDTITEGNQAHNQFLNVAATTGLAGLLFFASFYFLFYVTAIKLYARSDLTRNDQLIICCAFVVMTIFTVSSMFEVMFEFAKIRYLIVVCWAFIQLNFIKYSKLKN